MGESVESARKSRKDSQFFENSVCAALSLRVCLWSVLCVAFCRSLVSADSVCASCVCCCEACAALCVEREAHKTQNSKFFFRSTPSTPLYTTLLHTTTRIASILLLL